VSTKFRAIARLKTTINITAFRYIAHFDFKSRPIFNIEKPFKINLSEFEKILS